MLTVITTTLAGAEWIYGRFLFWGEHTMSWADFSAGFHFSFPFLLILTCHEFGHYFTAKYYNIKVTLPFYFPVWLGFIAFPSFGTMGAFIRIKESIHSRREYFDVGVAGPLAGFVVAIGVIWYGFTHLPGPDFIFSIHPEYEQYGLDYAKHVYEGKGGISFQFGGNLIFWFFQNYVVEDMTLLPHPNEAIHYPYLLAGHLALFFTALNLLPIGQLDGGHVMFGLFGQKMSRRISRVAFTLFLFYAGLGWLSPDQMVDSSISSSLNFLMIIGLNLYFIYLCTYSMIEQKKDRLMYAAIMLTAQYIGANFIGMQGYGGWVLFAIIIGRFIGVYHPMVSDNRPLSMGRKLVGWIAIVVFVLSFSPQPFVIK
ncbi:MAG: site-2 protease family protein [Cyclobacteriaceae bacterium]|nr:site-2 protease family protein [Cyclobacteriaceae bacterium HetDA_MAG_MS6]